MYQTDDLEFVVNQSIWNEGEVKFADVILPACTNFERSDIGEWANPGGYGYDFSFFFLCSRFFFRLFRQSVTLRFY